MNDPDSLPTDDSATQPLPDRLSLMFERQRQVIEKIQAKQGVDQAILPGELWGNLDSRHTAREIADNLGFCIEELVEALRELPARKPWKRNPDPADFHAFTSEMGDAFAFFLEACIFSGMTEDDFYRAFMQISDKNVERAEGTTY